MIYSRLQNNKPRLYVYYFFIFFQALHLLNLISKVRENIYFCFFHYKDLNFLSLFPCPMFISCPEIMDFVRSYLFTNATLIFSSKLDWGLSANLILMKKVFNWSENFLQNPYFDSGSNFRFCCVCRY
jgi:hypothetical protein